MTLYFFIYKLETGTKDIVSKILGTLETSILTKDLRLLY